MKDFYTTPPFYQQYLAKLNELSKSCKFLRVFTIGRSVLGRNIYAISIGNTSEMTLMAGAFHAQEWLTTSLLLRFVEHLSLSVRARTGISGASMNASLAKRGLLIVPMVNPDGVCIALEGAASAGKLRHSVETMQARSTKSWQANARGVDLNHNFDAGFMQLRELERASGIVAPNARGYGGCHAHSEPETMAMAELCHRYNFQSVYAFHSQGEEIFYEYGENTPTRSAYIARLLSYSNGYSLVKNALLYSHGGFKDYFIQTFNRPGFTIEIGKGENPLPITMLEDIYEKVLESMVIMAVI